MLPNRIINPRFPAFCHVCAPLTTHNQPTTMSIKTTHDVTRADAIAIITEKLTNLNGLSDEQLGYVLEEVVNNCFYNFSVVPDLRESTFYITKDNYPSEQR